MTASRVVSARHVRKFRVNKWSIWRMYKHSRAHAQLLNIEPYKFRGLSEWGQDKDVHALYRQRRKKHLSFSCGRSSLYKRGIDFGWIVDVRRLKVIDEHDKKNWWVIMMRVIRKEHTYPQSVLPFHQWVGRAHLCMMGRRQRFGRARRRW